MRKVAHYIYSDGNELQIFAEDRRIMIRDGLCRLPICPVRGVRAAHPEDNTEMADWNYETLGLYYGYEMADIGWDGDC